MGNKEVVKTRYLFSRVLSKDEKKWILECIEYVKSIDIPISNDIYFKHCRDFEEIGWCETEGDSKKAECTIALSIYLNIYPEWIVFHRLGWVHPGRLLLADSGIWTLQTAPDKAGRSR